MLASHTMICDFLKCLKYDVELEDRQLCQATKKKLEDALVSIESLKECIDARDITDIQRQNEIADLKQEVKSLKLDSDARISKNSENIANLQMAVTTIMSEKKEEMSPNTSHSCLQQDTSDIDKEDLEVNRQQMEERREKRKSVHLEDTLGKMKESVVSNQFNRDRIDSGVSISSNMSTTGLVLDQPE